jgi:hypothetical protein
VGSFKVIFLGLSVAGPEEEIRLLKGLQKKFNLTPEKAERLLQKVPIVIKKGISKEEMERYVRAIEEVGGKVRVEEDPQVESPVLTPPPPPPRFDQEKAGKGPDMEPMAPPAWEPPPAEPKKPYAGRTVTCPQCGFTQSETDDCVKCGVVISKFIKYQEMARSFEGQVHEISSEDKTSIWEGQGFFRAFVRTTREVLFTPGRYFKRTASEEGTWPSLLYGIICGTVSAFGAFFWQWLLFTQLTSFGRSRALPYTLTIVAFTIAIPFLVLAGLVLGTLVTHLCLMIVGGNKKGLQTTMRVVSYSFAGHLFGVIPIIGNTIGGVYALILTILGVKEAHEISMGKAVLAVLLPLIAMIGLFVLAVIALKFFFGSVNFLSAVGV